MGNLIKTLFLFESYCYRSNRNKQIPQKANLTMLILKLSLALQLVLSSTNFEEPSKDFKSSSLLNVKSEVNEELKEDADHAQTESILEYVSKDKPQDLNIDAKAFVPKFLWNANVNANKFVPKIKLWHIPPNVFASIDKYFTNTERARLIMASKFMAKYYTYKYIMCPTRIQYKGDSKRPQPFYSLRRIDRIDNLDPEYTKIITKEIQKNNYASKMEYIDTDYSFQSIEAQFSEAMDVVLAEWSWTNGWDADYQLLNWKNDIQVKQALYVPVIKFVNNCNN